jgi:hypothetical protein
LRISPASIDLKRDMDDLGNIFRKPTRRDGYLVESNVIKNSKCPHCGATISGAWSQDQALAFKPREAPTTRSR